MQYQHIKDIDIKANLGNRVFVIFLARDVDVRLQKDGVTKFLTVSMCDKDVKYEAKKFGATEDEIAAMQNGKVYFGAVDIKEYKGQPSCTIYNFEEYTAEPASNFIEWAEGMDEAQNIINNALAIISESIYSKLVYNILIENWTDFCAWTAASSMHHNMLGGLLVHTAEVIAQAEQIADFWEEKYGPNFINKPLLLSGALLHDIAKTKELNVDRLSGNTEYSTQASLETHITMCVSMIDIEAYKLQLGYQTYTINELNEQVGIKTDDQIKTEQEAVSLLKHCILSHHGKREYGSPIDMNIPEAVIINTADDLSAAMFRFNKNFTSMEPGTSSVAWLGGNMVVTYKESNKE